MVKGTERSLASVCASSVLPVPVGPISRMFALGQLDVVAAARLLLDFDALVVVVDGDGELLLRPLLADDVLVEELLDFLRGRQRRARAAVLEPVVVGDDVVADLDALVADEDRRARDQLADVVLVLVAERAPQDFGFAAFLHHVACPGPGPYARFADDIINNTVFLALVGRHDVVALGVVLDTLDRLAGVVHENVVDALAHAQDFAGCNINIGRLARQPRHQRLVDDNPGIRQRKPLALGPGRQQDRRHRRRLADAVWSARPA